MNTRGVTARRWVCLLVVALGLVHVLSEVLVNGAELVDLARRGVGGLPSAPDSQVAAFYSVMFGVLAAAAGQVMYWTATRFDALSVVPGLVLVAVGGCGAWLAPRAPFWAAIVLGVMVVIVARQPADSRSGGDSGRTGGPGLPKPPRWLRR